jgi:simple sugar transport system permease protein
MNIFYFVMRMCLYFLIPLLVVALGGMFSERSGVLNIALEGIMIVGAFAGIMFTNSMQDTISGQGLLFLAMLVSLITGVLYTALHAFAAISLKADQTISSTALNMFAPAFCIFLARVVHGVQHIQFNNTFRIESVPVLSKIPILGPILFENAYVTTYIGLGVLVLSSIVLFKTRFGLRLRACGENPQAADSLGINVYKMRYAGVFISGALGGVGGLIYVVPTVSSYSCTVAGYGFLALSVLIFGQWQPIKIFFAALFFSLAMTVASAYQSIPVLAEAGLPEIFYKCLPYVITLVVLAISSKNSHSPRAAGQPYDQGKR